MAQEAGLHVDMAGFQAAMEAAKELSRAGAKKGAGSELKFEAEATAYLQNRCGRSWGGAAAGAQARHASAGQAFWLPTYALTKFSLPLPPSLLQRRAADQRPAQV